MSFTSQDFGHPHGDWKIKVMGFYPKKLVFQPLSSTKHQETNPST
jgi:hypothetical protein